MVRWPTVNNSTSGPTRVWSVNFTGIPRPNSYDEPGQRHVDFIIPPAHVEPLRQAGWKAELYINRNNPERDPIPHIKAFFPDMDYARQPAVFLVSNPELVAGHRCNIGFLRNAATQCNGQGVLYLPTAADVQAILGPIDPRQLTWDYEITRNPELIPGKFRRVQLNVLIAYMDPNSFCL